MSTWFQVSTSIWLTYGFDPRSNHAPLLGLEGVVLALGSLFDFRVSMLNLAVKWEQATQGSAQLGNISLAR